ncbi:hypothetical protein ISCGN_013925 [Ixodes scapularis]
MASEVVVWKLEVVEVSLQVDEEEVGMVSGEEEEEALPQEVGVLKQVVEGVVAFPGSIREDNQVPLGDTLVNSWAHNLQDNLAVQADNLMGRVVSKPVEVSLVAVAAVGEVLPQEEEVAASRQVAVAAQRVVVEEDMVFEGEVAALKPEGEEAVGRRVVVEEDMAFEEEEEVVALKLVVWVLVGVAAVSVFQVGILGGSRVVLVDILAGSLADSLEDNQVVLLGNLVDNPVDMLVVALVLGEAFVAGEEVALKLGEVEVLKLEEEVVGMVFEGEGEEAFVVVEGAALKLEVEGGVQQEVVGVEVFLEHNLEDNRDHPASSLESNSAHTLVDSPAAQADILVDSPADMLAVVAVVEALPPLLVVVEGDTVSEVVAVALKWEAVVSVFQVGIQAGSQVVLVDILVDNLADSLEDNQVVLLHNPEDKLVDMLVVALVLGEAFVVGEEVALKLGEVEVLKLEEEVVDMVFEGEGEEAFVVVEGAALKPEVEGAVRQEVVGVEVSLEHNLEDNRDHPASSRESNSVHSLVDSLAVQADILVDSLADMLELLVVVEGDTVSEVVAVALKWEAVVSVFQVGIQAGSQVVLVDILVDNLADSLKDNQVVLLHNPVDKPVDMLVVALVLGEAFVVVEGVALKLVEVEALKLEEAVVDMVFEGAGEEAFVVVEGAALKLEVEGAVRQEVVGVEVSLEHNLEDNRDHPASSRESNSVHSLVDSLAVQADILVDSLADMLELLVVVEGDTVSEVVAVALKWEAVVSVFQVGIQAGSQVVLVDILVDNLADSLEDNQVVLLHNPVDNLVDMLVVVLVLGEAFVVVEGVALKLVEVEALKLEEAVVDMVFEGEGEEA